MEYSLTRFYSQFDQRIVNGFEIMTIYNISTDSDNWLETGSHFLIQGDYDKAASLYQEAIAAQPNVQHYYWYLGLILLLQGEEAEAQTTWLFPMMAASSEEIEELTEELCQVLESEAQRRENLPDYPVAWSIRQHIRELRPHDLNNLLQIVQLSLKLDKFTGEELNDLGIIQILRSGEIVSVDSDLLLEVFQNVLDYEPIVRSLPEFAEFSFLYLHEFQRFIDKLMIAATKLAYTVHRYQAAIDIAKLCLRHAPQNLEVLSHLTTFYHYNLDIEKSIETARLCCDVATTLSDRVFASCILLRELMMDARRWQEVFSLFKDYLSLLDLLVQTQLALPDRNSNSRIYNATFVLAYLRDDIKANRLIQNQVLQLFQSGIESYEKEKVEIYRQSMGNHARKKLGNRKIKLGYISYCLSRHSVGWLARWIFEHHRRELFEIYTYFVNYKLGEDNVQEWYLEKSDKGHKFGLNSLEIAEQIYQDEIDILIDLDSITLDITCEVMALKPAPVQVTWLGWDASGLPAIDYFIADPYVLPESAQDYYSEKIWRLPHTYIAVDGFEVGVPTLRRDELDIPSDAVIYLTAQKGYKRHPDTMRLQMKIIKEVPNSYFLIKGLADEESIKNFCTLMAEEEGVDASRLRFLPDVALESTHRANLGIADIILDTYPYNGATTTLETLWMCIPLVTRVGQQFAARNSYTMMMNVGVTEGIAWTDEEYVEWGIRLGKDEALRQQVVWKLRQSRHTSPLWNGKQFTREMEKAYEQMWARYVDTSG